MDWRNNFLTKKNIIFLAIFGILTLSIPLGTLLLKERQNLNSKADAPPESSLTLPQSLEQKVDLARGKARDIKDSNAGVFIEQDQAVCDQDNLDKTFGSLLIPGLAGKVIKNGNRSSLYGETNWWYQVQGEIIDIQKVSAGTEFTLFKDQSIVKVVATNKTAVLNVADAKRGDLRFKQAAADLPHVGDKVFFYLSVKCGGGQAPLLFLDTIQKIPDYITPKSVVQSRTESTLACGNHGRNAGNYEIN